MQRVAEDMMDFSRRGQLLGGGHMPCYPRVVEPVLKLHVCRSLEP